jgi:predicted lipoprotein with Yx(FWY)xxD motif
MNRMRMFATSLTLALLTGLMPGGPATVLAADQSPTIQVAQDANLGTILTGPNGMTLYLYTKDTPGVSNCYDRCATNWPPLLLKSGEQPAAPAGLKGTLGTTTRKDGSIQVTFNGGPLYFWNKDKAPGDTTGQNVNSVWFVLNPDGPTVKLAQNAQLGPILTAGDMTLYVYTKDTPGKSNCYNQCAVNWPPLLLKDGEQLNAPPGLAGNLGTTTRTDGTQQVTLNGAPLYFWNKDKAVGDTTGHKVNGVWFVAEPGLLLDTAGTWSQSSVSAAVRSGWVKADPDGNFHPGRQVSRAEFTAMLGAAFGTPAAGQASPADAQGAITRQEAVGMLVRALGLGAQVSDATTALARFTDGSKLTAESAGLMALAVDKGLLQGYPDGTIHGEATITHAEAVTLILRAMKLKQ